MYLQFRKYNILCINIENWNNIFTTLSIVNRLFCKFEVLKFIIYLKRIIRLFISLWFSLT